MATAIDNPIVESNRRELVRRLSRAAATLDKALFGRPANPARRVDYGQRQRQYEQEARRELRKLRDELAGMAL